MKRVLIALAAVVLFAASAYADSRCDNCMMKVAADSPYRVTVKFADGSVKEVCSIFCASMEKERAKDAGARLVVVDYNTGETLDADKAVWVEGGDIRAMMSDEPRVAFRDKESAEAFVKEHGGRVAGFDEVYQHSVNEWKGR